MLHWLHLRRAKMTVEEYAEHLRAIGVGVRPDTGRVHYYRDENDDVLVMEIGATFVYSDGRIAVVARKGVSDPHRMILLAHAELSFREKPSKASNWNYKPAKGGKCAYWSTGIVVTVDDNDPDARLIEAALTPCNEGTRADRADEKLGYELAPDLRDRS